MGSNMIPYLSTFTHSSLKQLFCYFFVDQEFAYIVKEIAHAVYNCVLLCMLCLCNVHGTNNVWLHVCIFLSPDMKLAYVPCYHKALFTPEQSKSLLEPPRFCPRFKITANRSMLVRCHYFSMAPNCGTILALSLALHKRAAKFAMISNRGQNLCDSSCDLDRSGLNGA